MSPLDPDACYRAVLARDARFDGVFFVGVKTTGIYCRPICPARTPGRDRVTFHRTAAEAERAGFRACFRCRPELAPGLARVDAVPRVVGEAMRRIEAGALADGSLAELARELGVSSRHLRRAMHAALGISPVELAQSRRLALARQLVADTTLPLTEVAWSSGFRSLRRFNAAFRDRYDCPPSRLRRARRPAARPAAPTLTLTLSYRPPYDWPGLLRFLDARAVPGVELVRGDSYLRTARVGAHRGWLVIAPAAGRAALRAEISLSLSGALMPLRARLRRLFDLDAQPATIAAHLARDPVLAGRVDARPGLRVPGAFDGFEAAVRAVLGQQVSVAAATTLAGRLAARFGEPIATPDAALTHLAPTPARIAAAAESEIAGIGVPRSRARTLIGVARAVAAGELSLDGGGEIDGVLDRLVAIPGIGPWTAHYLAMRAFGWPDAFPETDLGVRRALGGVSGPRARALAEPWRPWRAYAVTHLWTSEGAP
ncbi:MAG TPA: DNA-3-methyladenine glycosylase 2 [Polyangia bacterium]|jgi:AraC family transcriptional regulator of adaptative response / DNA-3-methyladenine glycosylase II